MQPLVPYFRTCNTSDDPTQVGGVSLRSFQRPTGVRLPNADHAPLEVDVTPAEPAELAEPEPASESDVPLFPSAEAELLQLAARAFAPGRFADDQLVFPTERGTPLDGSNFNHAVWSKALQRAGLGEWVVDENRKRRWKNRYRFHDLRHTAVSRLVAEGADVKLVQAVAGHSKSSLTLDRYTHRTDERVREAARRFDPARKR